MCATASERNQAGRGFTLVELLVVLAIGALLVAVAPFAVQRTRQSAEYRQTLAMIVSDMRTARARAQALGREVRFLVDLNQRSFGLEGGPGRPVAQDLVLRVFVASQELSSGVAAIRFLPEGGATGGSVDVIRPDGGGTRLRVDWFSGRVEQEPVT